MARKKLKYKDVVKKPGQAAFKHKEKKKHFIPKKTHKPKKPKYGKSVSKDSTNEYSKKFSVKTKPEEETKPMEVDHNIEETVSSSESENEIDNSEKLLKLLNPEWYEKWKTKKSMAIESEESSEEESDSDNNTSELITSDNLNDNDEDSENEQLVDDGNFINVVSDSQNNTTESDLKSNENVEVMEMEIDPEVEKEEENIDESNDPFVKHLFFDLSEDLLNVLQTQPIEMTKTEENWPELGRIIVELPKCEDQSINIKKEMAYIKTLDISDKKAYAPLGTIPLKLGKPVKPIDIHLKSQLVNNLKKANKSLKLNSEDFLTPLQSEIFSVLNNYQDFYFTNRTFSNGEEIRYVYCLHVINHILKTRTKITHHNAKLSKRHEVSKEFQDQGLVRPKALIIVPFKDSAYKIISMMISILLTEDKGNVINKKRFIEDYTGNELYFPKKNPKPNDFELTFTGNVSDDFKIGLSVTKKSLKLYSPFYSSDIIVASPLGLRTIIGAEGEPDRDHDFLSSIELLILDQTEMFLMQNWSHLTHVFDHIHLQPKNSHGTDLSRVRSWSLEGWAKYYRQTMIFSSMDLPLINALFYKQCSNYAGRVRTAFPLLDGVVYDISCKLRHCFLRFQAENAVQSIDNRFRFFTTRVLPEYRDDTKKQTVIFIPSYYDYVRIRNYFRKEDINFVQICEYSKMDKVARARDKFFHGEAHFLLYTERFHFFNRVKLKGVRHLILYQPPTFPHFYSEICNLMQKLYMNKKIGSDMFMTVTVIYSKYDSLQLAALIGTENAADILNSENDIYNFKTPIS